MATRPALTKRPGKESPFYAANKVYGAAFVVGAAVSHVANVGVTLLDPDGSPVYAPVGITAYLSSDAAGQILSSAPGGGVIIGTNGTILVVFTTSLAFLIAVPSTGLFDINITNNGAATYYLNLIMPDGTLVTSPVITLS